MNFKVPGGPFMPPAKPEPTTYEQNGNGEPEPLTIETLPEAVADVLADLKAAAPHDSAAAKAFLDHTHPRPKPASAPASLPGFTKALNTSLTDAAMLVARAIGTGKIRPSIGREVLASLADVANIKKADQIESALAEIDDRLKEIQDQNQPGGGHSAVDFVQGLVLVEIDDPSAPGGRRDTWADEQGNQVACILPVWGPGGARARERAVELGLREPRDPGKSIL